MRAVRRVAVRGKASEAEALKRPRYQWLLETGQEEEAGRVKEKDGDFVGAMNLFMQGGLPARAAQVLPCHHLCIVCWTSFHFTPHSVTSLFFECSDFSMNQSCIVFGLPWSCLACLTSVWSQCYCSWQHVALSYFLSQH